MDRGELKRVQDCGTIQRHSVYSDHTGIFVKLTLAKGVRAPTKAKKTRFSRDRLKDPETKEQFGHAAEDFIREEYGEDFVYVEDASPHSRFCRTGFERQKR